MDKNEEQYVGWEEFAYHVEQAGFERPSRQTVYGWWRRRDVTGFPELVHVTVGDVTRRKIPLSKGLSWRRAYVPHPGGRPARVRENG